MTYLLTDAEIARWAPLPPDAVGALLTLCEEGGARFLLGRDNEDEDMLGSGRVMITIARSMRGMHRPRAS